MYHFTKHENANAAAEKTREIYKNDFIKENSFCEEKMYFGYFRQTSEMIPRVTICLKCIHAQKLRIFSRPGIAM